MFLYNHFKVPKFTIFNFLPILFTFMFISDLIPSFDPNLKIEYQVEFCIFHFPLKTK